MRGLRLFVLLIQMSACTALFAGGQTLTLLTKESRRRISLYPALTEKAFLSPTFREKLWL
ncbi:MAG TPA: hypothetical protein PLZ16_03380 [Gammaproteobacteria bacterium]|nr:hypothetical protein [Gammaproteobacteria bacterium]